MAATPASIASNPIILVAEDDQMVREVLVELLQINGFDTIEAQNGREALELFHANAERISLLIIDKTMPELTGLVVLSEIRKSNKDIPIIIASGYDEGAITESLEPNTFFLQKPFNLPSFLSEVRKLTKAQ